MRGASLLLIAVFGGCSFPDVSTGDGLDTSSAGDPSGPGPGGTTSSDVAGPGPTSTGSAGGGGATTSSTSGATSTTSAQGGAGGTGGGGAATTSSAGGAPGTGGEGGAGGDGDGGGTVTSSSTAASTATATTTGGGGSGACPPGCEVLCGSAECPASATAEDCDGDGDPDQGDAPDCHPCNDRVFHGQQTYFVDPYVRQQGGMSFDYDCNGTADREYPLDSDGCGSLAACGAERIYALPALPACGSQAQYQNCTDLGVAACSNGSTGMALAGCR